MKSTWDQLTKLIPPPTSIDGGNVAWHEAEEQMGHRLPADYKWLMATYGGGSFCNELGIYHPLHPDPDVDLFQRWQMALDAVRRAEDFGEFVPYRVTKGSEEIISWGSTGNGDECYWVVESDDPDSWTVTVNEVRSPEWFPFQGSVTEFLVALLTGAHTDPVFDEEWLSDGLVFRKLSEPYSKYSRG